MRVRPHLVPFFLLAISLHMSRGVFEEFLGLTITPYFYIICIIILVIATYFNVKMLPESSGSKAPTAWMSLYFYAIILLTVYGVFLRNAPSAIVLDISSYIVFFCFFLLGRYDTVWREIEKPLHVMLWVALVLTLVGLTRVSSVVDTGQVAGSARPYVLTVGYRQSLMLNLWPVLFALSFSRPRLDAYKISGLASPAAYLAIQILFSKRAPSARAMAYVAAVLLMVFIFRRRARAQGLAVLVFLVIAVSVLPFAHVQSLLLRYQEEDRSRLVEATEMLDGLDYLEWLIGRGMGGSYPSVDGQYIVDLRSDYVADIREGRSDQRLYTHVGLLTPILKGGLAWALLCYWPALMLIIPKGRSWTQNPYNLVSVPILLVYVFFLIAEGPPTSTNVLDGVMFGLVCGRSVPVIDLIDTGAKQLSGLHRPA